MFSTAKVNALAPTTGTGNEKRRTLRKSANLRAEPPFIFFLIEEDKRMLCLINPLKLPRPERLDQLILFFLIKLGFCVRPSIYMFITEPAVPSKRILGLGSTLYLSNMQRMLNKSLSRFMQSLPRVRQNRLRKEKLCCQGATVRRKSLIVNCNIASNVRIKNQMYQHTCVQFAFLILSKATPSNVNEYKK